MILPPRRTFAVASLLAALASTGCEPIAGVDRSRIGQDEDGSSRGVLGGYRGGVVYGWAQGPGRGQTEVIVSVDGVETVILADLNRMDLVEKGISTDGNNAFLFDVGALPVGTEIAAFVAADGLELEGSPITVGE